MARKVLRQFCFRGDISKGLYNQLIYVGIYKSDYGNMRTYFFIAEMTNRTGIEYTTKSLLSTFFNMNCCQNKMSLLSETAITIILFPNHS